ncbi:MAG: hypothetical protein E6H09_00250 [Bacteroidetes bacterium]|jgi:hypothetical protein|nr:MAG: hypothetical protein E6H09_00250 [Bacteroidota bacterium]
MIVSREDINDLFSMFHDFDIVNIKLEKEVLVITINTPFGELWGVDEYILLVELTGCTGVTCEYLNKNGKLETTCDCDKISALGLDIQSYQYHPPRQYEFFCDGHNRYIESGQMRFDADTVGVFDRNHNQITLDILKKLATMRWESIQRMWDEQKTNNDAGGD